MAENKRFLELLNIDYKKHPVLAVVGGGGKTSLIYRLAKELASLGQRVIISTTTHMAYSGHYPVVRDGDREAVRRLLEICSCVMAAEEDEYSGKFCALPPEKLEGLKDLGAVLLIEADGSKGKPVKVPQLWEPVIPEYVNIVIGVIGLDCLNQPIGLVSHRTEKVTAFLGKEEEEILDAGDLVEIASSCSALRKRTEGKGYRVYFNKADVMEELSPVETIVRALKSRGIEAVYGSLREGGSH